MSDLPIRFVSDLHLGHEHSLIKDPRHLDFLLEGCSCLVVCGDLAELRAAHLCEEGLRQKRIFEEMCQQAGVALLSLAGNHDPEQEQDIYRSVQGRVVALHGHCLFKEVAPWGWEYLRNKKRCHQLIADYPLADTDIESRMHLARAMSLIVPPIMRNSSSKELREHRIIAKLKHICWPPQRPLAILKTWLTMDARMHRFAHQFFPEARLICYGHFHRRHLSQKGNALAVNLGAFFHHATSYIVDLDEQDQQAIVREASPTCIGNTVQRLDLSSRE
ncbi:MAG: hypothetical protein RSA21_07735 [Akkermansia sp.]